MNKVLFITATLLFAMSACTSKSDSELFIGTWEQQEFIYLSDLTDVLPHDEFGYEGCVCTYDGKTVSSYNIWYGTPTESISRTYTIDENAKTITEHAPEGDFVSDYEFVDENTMYLYFVVDAKKRKATYTRKTN